jgi:hypothetical protein
MLSVVYASTAAVPFSEEALSVLLERSQAKNARLGLTGLLLYKDGQFMQALEGAEDAVRDLYAVIAADPRHSGVRTLLEEQVSARQFPDWTMGFRVLTDDAVRQIPGYNTFFDASRGEAPTWATSARAKWLLEWFRHRQV